MNTKLATPLLALGLAACAHAQVIMIDFGPTTATGDNLTNSPYHTANSGFTGLSASTWNTTSTDITAGNVRYSDNTVATGVNVNVGTGSGAQTITLANVPTSSALGSNTNTLIYNGNSVGKDAIFTGSGNTVNGHIGVQVGGLAIGTYDIYISSRMTNVTNSAATYTQTVFAGVENSSTNFGFGSYTSATLTYENPTAASESISAWSVNENYVKFSVSITALGQFLNLAVDGGGSENRGFLNSVQIVSAIPEPSTYAVFGGFAALGLAIVARRRRNTV